MNIGKLIKAAEEIERLAKIQESKTNLLSELAKESINLTPEKRQRRLKEIDRNTVVDFGTAVEQLRKALHSK
jgi:hypothetical protein